MDFTELGQWTVSMGNRAGGHTIPTTLLSRSGRTADRIQSVSIIGAGVMGRGIAEITARAGIPVKVCDSDPRVARDAVDQILRIDDRHSLTAPNFVKGSAPPLISVAESDRETADADLIIETVTEDLTVKTAVLSGIQPYLRDDTIVASNTSSIEISQLTSAVNNAGRLCGLHFCHPVSKRPLVEIVGTNYSDSSTLSRAYQYAAEVGMAPILVRDTPGFLLNRMLVPYLNEALELLLVGAEASMLECAAIDFGMPTGPLAQFDEFGMDVALAVGRSLYRAYPDRIVPAELLIAMYKAGRMGRKSGGGFYAYTGDADSSELAPCVVDIIRKRQRAKQDFSQEQLTRRLFLPMLLEATRAIEESLVNDVALVDVALRDGLGMHQPEGGLIAWADTVGIRALLDWLKPLQPLGNRFEPTNLLLAAAADESTIQSLGPRDSSI